MKTVFFSASQQSANLYHCKNMTERQYCESLVDLLMKRLPPGLCGLCDHGMRYDQRPDYAKARNADVYLTIHTNAFNGKARGMEIGTSGSAQDQPLAEAIYKELEGITPATDRGIKRYDFFEAVQPVMPSCYLELSFHDNHEDEVWLQANQIPIADAILRGLCDYLGVVYEVPDKPEDFPLTKEQCVALLAELQELRGKYTNLVSTANGVAEQLKGAVQ